MATTYATIAEADAYHADRGLAFWTDATTEEKGAALLKATDYLEGLAWIDGAPSLDEEIDAKVVKACCYMAGEFIGGADPLAAQDRALSSMSVGSVSMTWETGASQSPQYPALRSILRGLLWSDSVRRLVW